MFPVLFKIGTFELHTFGVMMVLAFLTGMWVIRVRAPKYGLTANDTSDLSFWVLLAGVLGARLLFILQDLSFYLSHPKELFSIQFQGLTSFGGVFAGVAVVAIWSRRTGVPFRRYADLFAPGFLAGHVIGRFGCFFNGCCFGGVCPTNTPWGIHVAGSTILHHPAQIYDSVMNLVALFALLAYEKRAHALGQVAAMFFVLHGLTRFIYEFWRAGTVDQVNRGEASSTYWGTLPITEAQGVALAMMAVGFVLLFVYARKAQPAPTEVSPA